MYSFITRFPQRRSRQSQARPAEQSEARPARSFAQKREKSNPLRLLARGGKK